MNEQLDPLDPALEVLLEAERSAEFPRATLDRAWSKIAAGLAPLPLAIGPRASAIKPWQASHVVAVAASTFVLGVGTGIGIHAMATRALPAARTDSPAILTAVPTAPPPPNPIDPPNPIGPPKESETAPALSPVAPGGSTGVRSAAASASASSTRAERALVDEARSLLSAGDAAGSLALVDQHRRRFARPQFGEECEALAIQALVALGRRDEAVRRAASFRAASPNSLFLPVVDRALQPNR